MKISMREKRLIVGSFILIITVALYFLVISPIHEKYDTVSEEYKQVNNQFEIIKTQLVGENDMENLIAAYRLKIKSLESQLPSAINLEEIIDIMFNKFKENDIVINSITFSMNDRKEEILVDDTQMDIKKLTGPKSIEEILDEYENSRKTDSALNFNVEEINKIDYNNISYLSVNMSFSGNYYNLKAVLENLEKLDLTAVTTDINISKEEPSEEVVDSNSVNVGLSLAIPFYYDSEKQKDYIYDYSFDKGSDYIERGPFEYDKIILQEKDDTSSETSVQNHLDIYPDFYITLNSESSDLAAQTISQYSLSKSAISLNSNINERFELNISESSGVVSYQLKSQLDSFPSDNTTINFSPEGDDIIVKVISSSRGETNDNSSMTLILNNESSKKVLFYVFYDDERPRFNLVVNKGLFEILRE